MPQIDFEPLSEPTSKVDFEPLDQSTKASRIDFQPLEESKPPQSPTPASDKALSETPVSPAPAFLTPQQMDVADQKMIAPYLADAATGVAKGVGDIIPKSVGQAAKMLFYTPVEETPHALKEAYDVLRGVPIEQAVPESQTYKGFSQKPLTEQAKIVTGQVVPLALGLTGLRESLRPTVGGELNAKPISETAPIHVDVLDTGRPQEGAGQMPAPESGTGVQTRGQGQIVAEPPQETSQPSLAEAQAEKSAAEDNFRTVVRSGKTDGDPIYEAAYDRMMKARSSFKNAEIGSRHFGAKVSTRDEEASILQPLQDLNGGWDKNRNVPTLWKKGAKIADNENTGGIYETTPVDPNRTVLFRSVTLDDWKRIQAQGFIDSDLRGAIHPDEGMNLTPSTRTAATYIPHGTEGVVLAIKTDGLKLFQIGADDYLRTASKIPIENVLGVSDVIGKDKETGLQYHYPKTAPVPEASQTATVSGGKPEPPAAPASPESADVGAVPVVSDEPHVSAIANRFIKERADKGELGQITPGRGFSRDDLVFQGLKMPPEEINQHVSDLMQGTGDIVKQGQAVRVEEARLTQRSNKLSKLADADPKNVEARLAADNAFKDLEDFHNGPVAQLKQKWHATGLEMQGEIPVDLSTYNGLRQQWLRDVGEAPPAKVEPELRRTAQNVSKAIEEDNGARSKLSQAIDKESTRRKYPNADEVRNNIRERMGLEPCRT